MRASVRLIGRSSEGAHVLELDGVMAAVAPKVPERSLPNSVIYESQDALIAALPDLARHYEEQGIEAWTVWTPEDDERGGRRARAMPAMCSTPTPPR